MVMGEFEYKVERQTTLTNMCWCCVAKEKHKCKARVVTFHDHVVIKRKEHNHPPTFKGDCAMEPRKVTISHEPHRTFTRRSVEQKVIKKGGGKKSKKGRSDVVEYFSNFEESD